MSLHAEYSGGHQVEITPNKWHVVPEGKTLEKVVFSCNGKAPTLPTFSLLNNLMILYR